VLVVAANKKSASACHVLDRFRRFRATRAAARRRRRRRQRRRNNNGCLLELPGLSSDAFSRDVTSGWRERPFTASLARPSPPPGAEMNQRSGAVQ